MKKLLLSIMSIGLSYNAIAASTSGTTDFQVKVPTILILYHWDTATLNFNEYVKSVEDTKSHELTDNLGNSSYIITQNAIDTSDLPIGFDSQKVNVILENSWGVRAIASNSTVQLKLATQQPTLYLSGDTSSTDKIAVSDAILKSGSLASTTINIPTKWKPSTGDIEFNINMANVTKPGLYKSAASASSATDVFKLTLTGN